MRRRRQERLRAQGAQAWAELPAPRSPPDEDLRLLLLQPLQDRETELLLSWCIAASFVAGIIEVRDGSSTEQVKYRAKKGRGHEIVPLLERLGYRIVHNAHLGRGDCAISFQSPEHAHRALQEAALLNNWHFPWRSASQWGRPVQRTVEMPRKWFDGPPLRITSPLAQPAPCDDVTIVAGQILACMDHKRKSMSYFCSKCSVAPRGILPLVLYATYPAMELERLQGEDGDEWKLTAQMYGVREEARYRVPRPEVARLLHHIRENMDVEFGGTVPERQCVAKKRRENVLKLMRMLDQSGDPPMLPTVDVLGHREGAASRARRRGANPQDSFGQAAFSFLRPLEGNDLSAFTL